MASMAIRGLRPIFEPDEWQESTEALDARRAGASFEKGGGSESQSAEEALSRRYAINDEPGWLADFIAFHHELPIDIRQDVLETVDPNARLHKVNDCLARELTCWSQKTRFNRAQQEVDLANREHFLREQMRVIQGELGETDILPRN